MKATTSVALLLIVVLGATACVDDDKMFFIRQNQVPGSSCEVDTSTATFRSRGVLDVSVRGYGYYLNPLVVNNMLSTMGDNQPERNTIHMRSFKVSASLGTIPYSIPDFEIPVSGAIDPNGVAAFAGVEVLRSKDVDALAGGVPPNEKPVVQLKIRAIGDRSGDEMESAEFIYPVTLCGGCLVTMLTSCPTTGGTGGTTTIASNPCGLPQDGAVTCCTDSTGQTACLAGDDT